MSYNFIFHIGYYSDNITTNEIIKSDIDADEFKKYLDLIKDTLGFDFEEICAEWQDNVLPPHLVLYLLENNFNDECPDSYLDLHEPHVICSADEFILLLIFLVRKTYEKINNKTISIEINKEFPQVFSEYGYGTFATMYSLN